MSPAPSDDASLSTASPRRVVVLTGASSGIGRATALAFARRGAALVLASRSAESLEPVSMACERAGVPVLAVPTDVADAGAMKALADAALVRFGRIDVWVNGVGVGAVGRFEDTPADAHKRVLECNLLGHLNGCHAAMPHFRAQRRGLLVNMISLGGWIPAPYAAAYVASKFGVRGLSEALRSEVSDLRDVHICDVAPTFVDTPGLAHGANYTGRTLRPPPPLIDPRRVAEAIVRLCDRPRDVTWIGAPALPGRVAYALAPRLVGRTMRMLIDWALRRSTPAPITDGNLYAASRGNAVDGGHREGQAGLAAAGAGLAAVGLACAFWAWQRRGR